MKILFTVHQFFPDFASGTEVLTLACAQELRARGHDVAVLTGFPAAREPMADEDRFDRYEYQGVTVWRFHYSPAAISWKTNAQEAKYNNSTVAHFVWRLLDQYNLDLVHFFHFHQLSASMVDVCMDARIPTVYTPTDFWAICPTCQLKLPDGGLCQGPRLLGANCVRHVAGISLGQRLIQRTPMVAFAGALAVMQLGRLPARWMGILIKLCLRGRYRGSQRFDAYAGFMSALGRRARFLRKRINAIDKLAVPSQIMRDMLAANGIKRDNMVLCRYGIDLSSAPLSRAVRSMRGRNPRLRAGFIGTLCDHKGAHVLVEALKDLRDLDLDVRIYGRLEDFPDYVAELRTSCLDDPRVRFLGTFPNARIFDILADLDVLIVPSVWYENTPLVILSAQASGCPVIASGLGGMAEAVADGDDGLLFPVGNAQALAGCIARLVQEPGLLEKLSSGCRAPRSIQDYVDDLEQVYKELSARHVSPGEVSS